jgi:phosphoglycerate dehydrogenase-like enzyme
MVAMRIGLCVRGFTQIRQLLEELLPSDEIIECDSRDILERAADCAVLVPIVTPIPAQVLRYPDLKLIQQYGVGLDIVDIRAATEAGVLVANVPSVGTGNAESVAELAIAHMLMLSRNMPLALQRFREKKFSSPLGQCLWRSTVVILGYGGIGEEIARRLAGFGVRIIAISRHGPAGSRARDPAVRIDLHVPQSQMLTVLGEADFLVVAAPASPENIGLVDATVLAQLRPGAFIVNIARGPVIDYGALLAALQDGRLAGAGLDVFWQEPFDPADPLLSTNVIATPHIGGATARSLRGIGEAVAFNIEALRSGQLPQCCVNPSAQQPRGRGQPAP